MASGPKKILIVEDEETFALILKERLSVSGYEVKIAADAMYGVQIAHDMLPDLIVLDLLMPAGGGHHVLKNLNVSLRTRHIKVIISSVVRDEAVKKEVFQFPMVKTYLEKPYAIEKLLHEIETVLNVLEPPSKTTL